MIAWNIDFHNVAELVPYQDGHIMHRVPADVRAHLNEGLRERSSWYATGVELRFRLRSDQAVIRLRTLPMAEAQVAHVYYGSMQGGWQNSSRLITTQATDLIIPRPGNPDQLTEIHRSCALPFSPEVVRVVLPYGSLVFLGIEGDVEPPRPEDLPERTYLAYGSSITHGSLALDMPHTYAFRIAQMLGCDYRNLGFAGTAHLEKEMAEYIVSRQDWDFASVEMGINMLLCFSLADFERRVDDFTAILAADPRPVFATSLFGFWGEHQQKAAQMRQIVGKYAQERLHYIDGLELLDHPAYLSQDMVHPSLEGQDQIARRWQALMAPVLREKGILPG